MIKKLTYSILAAGMVAIIASSYTNQTLSNSGGGPTGHTGSPSDGKTCGSNGGCHSGNPVTAQTGWISTNVPAAGYVGDSTYTITASATHASSSKFGFQASAQDASGNKIGTLIATNATALSGSGKYINHKSTSTSGAGIKSWNFTWTAPSSGTGDVNFYVAFNATNAMTNTSGDTVYTSTLTIIEDTASVGNGTSVVEIEAVEPTINIYPNPVQNSLNISINQNINGATLQLVDVKGSVVKVLDNNFSLSANSQMEYDVTSLESGTYVLMINSKEVNFYHKVIVE